MQKSCRKQCLRSADEPTNDAQREALLEIARLWTQVELSSAEPNGVDGAGSGLKDFQSQSQPVEVLAELVEGLLGFLEVGRAFKKISFAEEELVLRGGCARWRRLTRGMDQQDRGTAQNSMCASAQPDACKSSRPCGRRLQPDSF